MLATHNKEIINNLYKRVITLEDAEELLSELNNVCVDYGDGFFVFKVLKEKDKNFYFYRFLFMGRLLLNHLFMSPVFFH